MTETSPVAEFGAVPGPETYPHACGWIELMPDQNGAARQCPVLAVRLYDSWVAFVAAGGPRDAEFWDWVPASRVVRFGLYGEPT